MCIFWQLGCCYFAEHNQFFFQFANEIVAWILLASERVPLDGVRFGSIPQSAQTFTQFLHIGQLTFLSTMEDICLYLSQGQDPTRLIALSNNKTNLAPFFFFNLLCSSCCIHLRRHHGSFACAVSSMQPTILHCSYSWPLLCSHFRS